MKATRHELWTLRQLSEYYGDDVCVLNHGEYELGAYVDGEYESLLVPRKLAERLLTVLNDYAFSAGGEPE